MKRRKFNQPRTMGDDLRSGSGSTSSNSVAPSVMSAPLHQPTRQYGQAPLPPPPPSSTHQYGQAPPPPPRTMGDVLRSISGSTSSNSSSVAPSVISAPLHRSTRFDQHNLPILLLLHRRHHHQSLQHKNKSKLSSVARELHGPLHTTGRKHSAQLRLEMDQSGEPTDKMSVWIKARNKQDPDVIEVIEVFENHLLNEPEDQRSLAVVRDKIFHEIMGKDGHGYCRTFGSFVPRSLVYPKSSSSSSENTTDLLKMISEQLKQFGERLEKLEARVISNENNDRNTNEIVDGSSEADRRSFTGEEHNTNTPSPKKSAPEQD